MSHRLLEGQRSSKNVAPKKPRNGKSPVSGIKPRTRRFSVNKRNGYTAACFWLIFMLLFEGNTTYNGYVIKNNVKVEPKGPFVVEKRSYFSEEGKRVRFLQKAYLRETGEAVPITQIQDINEEKYGAVCSLPFISLIEN